MTHPHLSALLVGVGGSHSDWPIHDALAELKELAKTAGITTVGTLSQERNAAHPKHYIGKGKITELTNAISCHQANLIICNDELTPNQTTFLESHLQIKVLDRTSLILDIFASRAYTYEAQLQVEYAQLNYLMPRLTRLWTHLSRQSGGIGARGPGETQLETDKRQIRKRMTLIKQKLAKLKEQRQLRRHQRNAVPILTCALVGYTNAGKSTLMNQLTQANVLAEDQLFATLDPTSRRFKLPNNQEMVLTDTVGFIHNLPHHLVKAFYSTLEEVTHADILLHIIDSAHPNIMQVIDTAQTIISDLKAHNKPTLYVFNKWELIPNPNTIKEQLKRFSPAVFVSATQLGTLPPFFKTLTTFLDSFHHTYDFLIPYDKSGLIHTIRHYGRILSEDHTEIGTQIKAALPPAQADQIMHALFQNDK